MLCDQALLPQKNVKGVCWHPTHPLLATCGRDSCVYVWAAWGTPTPSAPWLQCAATLEGHTEDVKLVQWHPYRKELLSAGYDTHIKVTCQTNTPVRGATYHCDVAGVE